jgi:hypothetical protein
LSEVEAEEEELLLVAAGVEVFGDGLVSVDDEALFASPSLDGVAALSALSLVSAFSLTLDDADLRESVTYQPEPLKTMPTGWMTLRRLPPHASHTVSGASEKLCRLSVIALHDVHV